MRRKTERFSDIEGAVNNGSYFAIEEPRFFFLQDEILDNEENYRIETMDVLDHKRLDLKRLDPFTDWTKKQLTTRISTLRHRTMRQSTMRYSAMRHRT